MLKSISEEFYGIIELLGLYQEASTEWLFKEKYLKVD